jgi:hypothetical protein
MKSTKNRRKSPKKEPMTIIACCHGAPNEGNPAQILETGEAMKNALQVWSWWWCGVPIDQNAVTEHQTKETPPRPNPGDR